MFCIFVLSFSIMILYVLCDICVKQSNPQFWSMATTAGHPIWLLSITFQQAVQWCSSYSWRASQVHMKGCERKSDQHKCKIMIKTHTQNTIWLNKYVWNTWAFSCSSFVIIILHIPCDSCVKKSNPQFWSLATTVTIPFDHFLSRSSKL